jgi:hypothetical protein
VAHVLALQIRELSGVVAHRQLHQQQVGQLGLCGVGLDEGLQCIHGLVALAQHFEELHLTHQVGQILCR